jgi:hypothetical protein
MAWIKLTENRVSGLLLARWRTFWFHKSREFIGKLNKYRLLYKYGVPCSMAVAVEINVKNYDSF